MRRRDGWVLAALIAAMALSVWGFSGRPGTKAVYAPDARTAGGVVRVDGRALIDLNAADEALLRELPGIGETLAGRIVEAREALGGFDSVDALMDVPGIAARKLDAIRPRVTVTGREAK